MTNLYETLHLRYERGSFVATVHRKMTGRRPYFIEVVDTGTGDKSVYATDLSRDGMRMAVARMRAAGWRWAPSVGPWSG